MQATYQPGQRVRITQQVPRVNQTIGMPEGSKTRVRLREVVRE